MPGKGFVIGSGTIILVGLIATAYLYRVYADIPDPAWDQIKAKIRKDFPDVPEITTGELAATLKKSEPPVLIDCRAPEEFAVSHLPEAIHAASAAEVGAVAKKDAEVVVYCSVGYRSARLAKQLLEAGFANAKNLEGSIFQWANQKDRPIVRDKDEPASTVHPYSKRWGALLKESKRHPLK